MELFNAKELRKILPQTHSGKAAEASWSGLGSWGRAGCLLVLLMCMGCAGLKYTSEHDPRVSYPGLKTYAWFPDEERPPGTQDFARPEVAALIRRTIDSEMMAKGFVATSRSEADFLVAFRANAENEFSRSNRSEGSGGDRYDFSVRGGQSALSVKTRGTLTIAFINDKARKAFWKGMATGVLKEEPVKASLVKNAVQKILNQYPPTSAIGVE